MASISQLKLPDNTIYNIKGSIHTVIGTQTASTGSWTGNLTSIDALYDGLTIAYYLPYAGSGNASLNLTLKNNVKTGAVLCYLANNTRLTTEYEQGSVIYLTYFSAGAISINGTATTAARWIAQADMKGGSEEGDTAYYDITTEEIGSAEEGTPIAADDITNWSAGSAASLTTTTHTIPNVTSAGSAPTLGTAIPADDITAWTTNTPTTISYTSRSIPNVTAAGSASVSNGTLSISDTTLGTAISADDITAYTEGTAASLSYTAKSIPNVTSVGSAPTLGTAFSVKAVDTFTANTLPSLSYTARTIPNISVTPTTVVTSLTPGGTLVPNVYQDNYNGLVMDNGAES